MRNAVSGFSDPSVTRNLTSLVANLSNILGQVQNGDGALHALIFDRKTTADVKLLIAHASQAALRLDDAVGHVDALLKEARDGKGAVHALFYEKKGAQAVAELGDAASELSGLIRDAKSSRNGAVHQLVYGDASALFANLGSAAADLKKITGSVAAGKGTLGALIEDPTVYDDLRSILGNVKRNRVLRALVRYSISNGEELEKVGKPEKVEASPKTR